MIITLFIAIWVLCGCLLATFFACLLGALDVVLGSFCLRLGVVVGFVFKIGSRLFGF